MNIQNHTYMYLVQGTVSSKEPLCTDPSLNAHVTILISDSIP